MRWIPILSLWLTSTASHAASINGLWDREALGRNLAEVALFGLAGVLIAILGYKVFDAMTPGDLDKEILENRNLAAAVVAASVIIGVSIIVASSIRH